MACIESGRGYRAVGKWRLPTEERCKIYRVLMWRANWKCSAGLWPLKSLLIY